MGLRAFSERIEYLQRCSGGTENNHREKRHRSVGKVTNLSMPSFSSEMSLTHPPKRTLLIPESASYNMNQAGGSPLGAKNLPSEPATCPSQPTLCPIGNGESDTLQEISMEVLSFGQTVGCSSSSTGIPNAA